MRSTSTTNHGNSRSDLYAEIADRIISALEQGVDGARWSTSTEGGPERNGGSGHVFRGTTTVLTGAKEAA